jgi:hypothetical protein
LNRYSFHQHHHHHHHHHTITATAITTTTFATATTAANAVMLKTLQNKTFYIAVGIFEVNELLSYPTYIGLSTAVY